MQAVFYGVGACVIGIIAQSAYKLTKKTIGTDWLLWSIYLVNAVSTIITQSERVKLILAGEIPTWLITTPPKNWFKDKKLNSLIGLPLIPIIASVPSASSGLLWQIFTFFVQRVHLYLQWVSDRSFPLWWGG
ncbi:hypothetical protein [Oscillatoria sp. FACHB-1407]|uniref:hypothetical protein n=1 Tax=Oscillatoria sp. FACHB-1407 TaxID=2692847 RepID=UPI0018EFA3E8|nr:hypothetical protein [Oscillatoria sp. FACHB-1407]